MRTTILPTRLKEALTEKLAESLAAPFPEATPRLVHGAVRFPNKATAIVGIRRGGKTTFLHQLRRERLAEGTPRELLPYLNFEDERLAGLGTSQLGFLLEEYGRRHPYARERGIVTWSLDEIQAVPGWERFVRRLLDSGRVEVTVTGSSAALLSREIATALRGRAWEVPLFPFNFVETLLHQDRTIPTDPSLLTGAERARTERAFLDWLNVGGFPEAQGLDETSRAQLLRDYVDVAILRDVVERHGVSNIAGLRWLVRHLLRSAAGLFSVEKFYAALKSQGVAISKDTIHQLLSYLEDCFLVRMVWMESDSERQRMVNPRKAYPVDSGLISVFDQSGRVNIGHALETAVLIELERRRCAVTYIRTPGGREVDFLARGADGKAELIQVCADASDPETGTRELEALTEAGAIWPQARQRLLTLTRDGIPPDIPESVIALPAYEWLIEKRTEG